MESDSQKRNIVEEYRSSLYPKRGQRNKVSIAFRRAKLTTSVAKKHGGESRLRMIWSTIVWARPSK